MTAPSTPGPAQPTVVTPEAGSRLEALAQAYALAKPAADAAKLVLDEITDAIKLELTNAAPGALKVDLHAPALEAPLRLAAVTKWGLDTTRFKAEQPETYVQFAKQSTYWVLKAIANRGGS